MHFYVYCMYQLCTSILWCTSVNTVTWLSYTLEIMDTLPSLVLVHYNNGLLYIQHFSGPWKDWRQRTYGRHSASHSSCFTLRSYSTKKSTKSKLAARGCGMRLCHIPNTSSSLPNRSSAGRRPVLHHGLYGKCCTPVPRLNAPILQQQPGKVKIQTEHIQYP